MEKFKSGLIIQVVGNEIVNFIQSTPKSVTYAGKGSDIRSFNSEKELHKYCFDNNIKWSAQSLQEYKFRVLQDSENN